MSRDRHTDDRRRSDRRRTEDVYQNDDERGGFLAPMGWPTWPATGAAEETSNETYDEERATGERDTDDDGWAESAVPLLFIGGLVLFFIPEPVTSAVGVLLMGVGIVLWAVSQLR